MFIEINGTNYNIDFIKSYQKLWKKKDKEYVKNGSIVELQDGTIIECDYHVEIEEKQITPTIIPALSGWELIQSYECDEGGTEFFVEPIIAWQVGDNYIFPITVQTSWEDLSRDMSYGIHEKSTGNVYRYDHAVYESLDAYKEATIKKHEKAE